MATEFEVTVRREVEYVLRIPLADGHTPAELSREELSEIIGLPESPAPQRSELRAVAWHVIN